MAKVSFLPKTGHSLQTSPANLRTNDYGGYAEHFPSSVTQINRLHRCRANEMNVSHNISKESAFFVCLSSGEKGNDIFRQNRRINNATAYFVNVFIDQSSKLIHMGNSYFQDD